LILQAYLHILIRRSLRLVDNTNLQSTHGRGSIIVRAFNDLLRDGNLKPSVSAYSDALGVTPGHLAETLKKMTGLTPGQHIRTRQVAEAKRLLAHTERTVSEIAYDLRFNDAAYFGRFFKRETGVTPGQFRQTMRSPHPSSPEAAPPTAPVVWGPRRATPPPAHARQAWLELSSRGASSGVE
jgi:AraC family transcriptional regulator, transcriptional activator of pobA